MARPRTTRRSARTQKTPDPTGTGATATDGEHIGPQTGPQTGEEVTEVQDDKCPACKNENVAEPGAATADKEKWVRCDACKTWFHWRCVGQGGDLDAVDQWYACVLLFVSISLLAARKP